MRRLILAAAFVASSAQAATVSVTVIDREGNPVQDAVVVVVPARPGTPARALPASALIAQARMQFVPAVTLVGPAARLTFVNQDNWEHHVRGSPAGMAQLTGSPLGGFELRLDGAVNGTPGKTADVTLDRLGGILLGCHIHGSMRGHVYVSESPWATKTTADGQAVFEDLPEGPAQVRVWQADQLLDLPARPVAVGASPSRLSFQLQVVPRRRRS